MPRMKNPLFLAAAIFLQVSCGTEVGLPISAHGIALSEEILAEVSTLEADFGVEALAGELEAAGLMRRAVAIREIEERRLTVRAEPEPFPAGDALATGVFLWPSSIVIWWTPERCFAGSAFNHEVLHSVLCLVDPGCDADHALTLWWDAEGRATGAWAAQSCPNN